MACPRSSACQATAKPMPATPHSAVILPASTRMPCRLKPEIQGRKAATIASTAHPAATWRQRFHCATLVLTSIGSIVRADDAGASSDERQHARGQPHALRTEQLVPGPDAGSPAHAALAQVHGPPL